ncbi:hypothetical protein QA600_22235 [Natronococcus sp. A-GB1]|nr:hypothetical protein [Natronococcus sp. A-GB1]MDG5762038.1 hypothetical protein [Natronococcus sp. A-GB1]
MPTTVRERSRVDGGNDPGGDESLQSVGFGSAGRVDPAETAALKALAR